MVPRFFLKPHWLSWRRPCFKWEDRRFGRILAKIFPAIERREIPRWLSHDWWFLLHLYRWMIVVSLKSCGIISVPHIWRNSLWSLLAKTEPAFLKIWNWVMAWSFAIWEQGHWWLFLLNSWWPIQVVINGNLRKTVDSFCIYARWLLEKCLAQRSWIFSFSVINVFPSALRRGDGPDGVGP